MQKPPKLNLDAEEFALFLDIDGTLLEHADHPEAVSVSEDLRLLLEALEQCLDGALAFVTGRSIAVVDRLFAPLQLRAAGLYGLEHRLTANGPVEIADEPPDIAALAEEIETEFKGANVFIERKGPILALHTRAAPHLLARAVELVEQALDRLPQGYRALAGNAGVELMPLEAAKGAAIRRFMKKPAFAGRRPVFLGDDTSDENGFEAINELGGISIRIRQQGPTAARYSLIGVAEAIAWLEGWLATRNEHLNRR
jgi:trehalose 6-phosphate phosphatase